MKLIKSILTSGFILISQSSLASVCRMTSMDYEEYELCQSDLAKQRVNSFKAEIRSEFEAIIIEHGSPSKAVEAMEAKYLLTDKEHPQKASEAVLLFFYIMLNEDYPSVMWELAENSQSVSDSERTALPPLTESDRSLPPCSKIDHTKPVATGFRCLTSEKAIFERVEIHGMNGWQAPDKKIWSDELPRMNFSQAAQKCSELNGRLPSAPEWIFLSNHTGVKEVFRDQSSTVYQWYWTSTRYYNPPNFVRENDFITYNTEKSWVAAPYQPNYFIKDKIAQLQVRCILAL